MTVAALAIQPWKLARMLSAGIKNKKRDCATIATITYRNAGRWLVKMSHLEDNKQKGKAIISKLYTIDGVKQVLPDQSDGAVLIELEDGTKTPTVNYIETVMGDTAELAATNHYYAALVFYNPPDGLLSDITEATQ